MPKRIARSLFGTARHDVCGEADSIPEARSKISEHKPDLLLTALRLGIGDSLEFIKALKVQAPGLLILMYAAFTESIFVEWALRAGANGYLIEDGSQGRITDCDRRYFAWPDLYRPGFRHAPLPRIAGNVGARPCFRKFARYRQPVCPGDACFSVDRFRAGHKEGCPLVEAQGENDRNSLRKD